MFRIKHRILIMTLAIVALLAMSVPVLAANMTVDPVAGGYDTTFSISVTGFNRGETIARWVTLPNLQSVSLGKQVAANDGTLDFDITIDPKWPQGEFIAVAHGLSSGREYFTKFNVSGAVVKPTPVSTSTPTGNGPMVWIGHPGGKTMWYQGRGYSANELVAAWYHAANSPAIALPNQRADAWGNLVFSFTVPNGSRYGGYLIVAQGLTSKHKTTNTVSYFGTLTDQRASDPIKKWAPSYEFVADGFQAGERVSIWVTLPNGTSQALATVTTLDGLIDYTYMLPPTVPYGGYIIVAYGWMSRVQVWERFSYFGTVNPMQ